MTLSAERGTRPVPAGWAAGIDAELLATNLGPRRGGAPESADELLDRVAGALGDVERRYGGDPVAWTARFRALMTGNRFWPSGRILDNSGTRQSQLASCFVLPLQDEFAEIFRTLQVAAACHRTGGGTGFDLTPLRERGAGISSAEAAGASGPVSWLALFDAETQVVAAGGKMRGANLASLSVRHPDVLEFVDAKREVGRLHNFNLSVAVDDEFMQAVAAGGTVELVSPLGGPPTGRLPAAEIWDRICTNAWRTGDPGLLFVDAINRANPLRAALGPIRTTNPCGEQTLYPYEASNLGSVNLAAFLLPDHRGVDWAGLEATVTEAVRLLDNAIDASHYPDPRITAMARANRRLGLGVMGYADLLVGLGVRYDSEEALRLVDRLGTVLHDAAWAASRELAAERGPFPNFGLTGWDRPVRNCAVTTIAPTGTISMVAGCSSGIEPRFAAIWTKDVLAPDGIGHVDEDLLADLRAHTGLDRADALAMLGRTPVGQLPVPPAVLDRYRYAHDIPGEWHVRTSARWQRYVDNAVSKTVNLPRHATVADTAAVLTEAWRSGCKGVSVYRQGSRDRDLLEVGSAGGGAAAVPEPPRQSRQRLLSRGSERG